MLILEPTRAEAGCVRIHLYESTRGPWLSSFTPNGLFLGLIDELITHPLQAVRTKQIG
jgi:hypothetical protein